MKIKIKYLLFFIKVLNNNLKIKIKSLFFFIKVLNNILKIKIKYLLIFIIIIHNILENKNHKVMKNNFQINQLLKVVIICNN